MTRKIGTIIDETGKQFGAWTVLSMSENRGCRGVRWICQCACGKISEVDAVRLRAGRSRSCGCRRFVVEDAEAKQELHLWLGEMRPLQDIAKLEKTTHYKLHTRMKKGMSLLEAVLDIRRMRDQRSNKRSWTVTAESLRAYRNLYLKNVRTGSRPEDDETTSSDSNSEEE